ncbi:MalY/PatB family protein [Micromonospora radicis]|uniref:cysteine-S-conjugate beta-lyase n=1 Tax=Micromonospora radicis TaxID=1894971 RepID=A0A418N1W5_9ACTN|nr:MalY/PatB family protein [Micromonospora radicis]RIV41589.1 pyridoxal phosphate-dependent aminotransferase [Micromonospora radicis]
MASPVPGPAGRQADDPLTALTLAELRQRTSVKWRTYAPDVLPLWVAEQDVPLAAPVAEALHRAIDLGDTGYACGTEFAEAVGSFAARRWGWPDFRVAHTTIVPDVMMGAVEVLRLVTDPGDAVVVCPPVYSPFYAFLAHAGWRVVDAPLGADLRMDPAVLEDAFRQARAHGRRPAFLLCNPHNPTGVVHRRDELAVLAELADRYGVRVVSDEIHAPLVLPGAQFTPYLTVPGAENAFALTSASKAWNLAGLKAALVVAGPRAADDLRRMPEEVSHGPSHLGVIAHTAAFRAGEQWLDLLLTGLDANRARLGELLAEQLPEITYHRPEGTFLAWLDCTRLGVPTEQPDGEPGLASDLDGPAKMFLDRGRVAFSSGHVFGPGGTGFVRLNLATTPEILTEAVTRMSRAVQAHRRSA